jgi:hypothetical protein
MEYFPTISYLVDLSISRDVPTYYIQFMTKLILQLFVKWTGLTRCVKCHVAIILP